MSLSINDWQQIEHVARLAVLAMCARGVASAERQDHDEVQRMVVTVSDLDSVSPSVDVEFYGSHPVPLGGLSL